MRYSNTAITELSAKYRSVLKKCALLNAAILLSTAVVLPAGAETLNVGGEKQNGGWLLVYKMTDGTMNYNEEEATVHVTPVSDKISAQNFWASIQTFKSSDIHPSITVSGNSNTVLNMTAAEDDWLIVSRFAPVTIGTETSPIGTINMSDTVLEDGTLIYVTAGNSAEDSDKQNLQIFGNNITMLAKNTDGTTGVAITGNEGKMTLVANDKLDITGNIEGYNTVYGGHSNMTFNINQNAGNSAVTTIRGNINAAKGSVVNIGLNGDGSSVTGDLLVSANGTTLPGGEINLTFGKNGSITGNITAQDQGSISVTGTDIVNVKGDVSVDSASELSFENVALNGTLTNAGTTNVAGALDTAAGSIVNTGTITFASGSQLKAALNNSTALISGGTVTGTTALMVENGTGDAKFKMFDVDQTFDLTNSLYDVVKDTEVVGQYLLSKKSTDEVVENLTKNGEATAQEAATISAIADTTVSNPVLDKITEAVQSGDVKTAAKAAKDLAPTTSQAALGISKDLVGMMANVAAGRMAGLAGRAGGDVFKGGSMWVQGLFNHTKQDSTSGSEGFKANSKGIAFGIDGKLNDAVTVGLGYGYTKTDADAGNRDIDVDGNNFFAYAEYAPDAWYVNGVLNFGYGRYTEKKSPAGYTTKSKYDVYTYGANLMTGYAFESGLTPEGGLRYLLVDQKSYDDGIQKISTSNNDVLTAVLGAKYGYKVKAKDWMFTPNVRLAATYDMMSDGSKAVASITSGSSYQITGERLHRLGFEAGVGVTSTWNNWDFTLSYDGGFRKDYQSHTGTLKAKYHF